MGSMYVDIAYGLAMEPAAELDASSATPGLVGSNILEPRSMTILIPKMNQLLQLRGCFCTRVYKVEMVRVIEASNDFMGQEHVVIHSTCGAAMRITVDLNCTGCGLTFPCLLCEFTLSFGTHAAVSPILSCLDGKTRNVQLDMIWLI